MTSSRNKINKWKTPLSSVTTSLLAFLIFKVFLVCYRFWMYWGCERIFRRKEEVTDSSSPLLESTSSCHTSTDCETFRHFTSWQLLQWLQIWRPKTPRLKNLKTLHCWITLDVKNTVQLRRFPLFFFFVLFFSLKSVTLTMSPYLKRGNSTGTLISLPSQLLYRYSFSLWCETPRWNKALTDKRCFSGWESCAIIPSLLGSSPPLWSTVQSAYLCKIVCVSVVLKSTRRCA